MITAYPRLTSMPDNIQIQRIKINVQKFRLLLIYLLYDTIAKNFFPKQ